MFRLLVAWVGLAFIFFGGSASLPSILLSVYGLGITFPALMETSIGGQWAQATAWVVHGIAGSLIPLSASGTSISMTTSGGEVLTVLVNEKCSGAASISVFIAVFALMSLDTPLPGKTRIAMLLFGIAGTVAQNLLRLVLLLLAGYYAGPGAAADMEGMGGYVLFPLWYVLFAYVYLAYAARYRKTLQPVS
ncbi:MAG TPA: exosortase/archaeosortase family protein [Candidatus Methanoperedenaceae archaeon]|nr:exosortase/archaeosortase family protein [Candidatus Methanoperedenaceae archaeon]